MQVNADFAFSALRPICAVGKMQPMRVRLAEIRGERRLEDIADALDVAISTVQRWEKGTMAIPSLRLPEIAKVYGCAVTDIFAEDEQVPRSAEIVRIWDRIPLEQRRQAEAVLRTFAASSD